MSAFLFFQKCTVLLFKMAFFSAYIYMLHELANDSFSLADDISLEIYNLIIFLYGFLINKALYFTITVCRNILDSSIDF